ncbi:MAG: hypothetical protein KF718_29610 [Polyangiaceae bacterium]|nr:hypothetical protein [Polyangiaceae bacterium]
MAGLGLRALRLGLRASALVLLLGLAAAVVRLLPWWLAEDVPWEVSLPFARALVAAALEASLWIGAPVGVSLAVAVAVERGEVRTLATLGVGPVRLAASFWPLALGAGLTVLAVDMTWDARSDPPGAFARQLVEEARVSCLGAESPQAQVVPMVGVTWLCFPGQAPRVLAELPGSSGQAWVLARKLSPSDDLSSLELVESRTRIPAAEGRPAVVLSAEHALVRGLPSWGRGTRLSSVLRGVLASSSIALTVLGVVYLVVSLGLADRALALPVGLLPPVASLAALSRLESAVAWPIALLGVPAVSLATLGIVVGLARALEWRRRRVQKPLDWPGVA